MNENIGLLPSCWGNLMWSSIHSIAFTYNPSLNRASYFNFFMLLGNILPCNKCKVHYYEHLDKDELNRALDTNEGLFKWTYDLHNMVNKSLEVPESEWPSYEKVWERYNSFKSDCSTIEGMCSTSVSKKKITVKIIEDDDYEEYKEFYYKLILGILVVLLLISIGYIVMLKSKKK